MGSCFRYLWVMTSHQCPVLPSAGSCHSASIKVGFGTRDFQLFSAEPTMTQLRPALAVYSATSATRRRVSLSSA